MMADAFRPMCDLHFDPHPSRYVNSASYTATIIHFTPSSVLLLRPNQWANNGLFEYMMHMTNHVLDIYSYYISANSW